MKILNFIICFLFHKKVRSRPYGLHKDNSLTSDLFDIGYEDMMCKKCNRSFITHRFAYGNLNFYKDIDESIYYDLQKERADRPISPNEKK